MKTNKYVNEKKLHLSLQKRVTNNENLQRFLIKLKIPNVKGRPNHGNDLTSKET